jgi:hypothetical protein
MSVVLSRVFAPSVALSLALGAAAVSTPAFAKVDLIAIGQLSGMSLDRSRSTAGPLENGAPGNLLGGLGSGLAYAGCDTFLAVPDRGPNAIPYNSAIDDTASYINRFQTLSLRLAPAKGASLPYTLTPKLVDTTLLHAREPLAYGGGAAENVANGAPALNALHHTHYFTGRSDNFDPARLSTYARDGRFDPESIRVSSDGASVFISDEYGPYVYRFDRKSGERTGVYAVPQSFAVSTLSPMGESEISVNTSGRVANKGMEGLAISPDGNTLFGAMQSPLIQDGGTDGAYTRIVRIDVRSGKATQYVSAHEHWHDRQAEVSDHQRCRRRQRPRTADGRARRQRPRRQFHRCVQAGLSHRSVGRSGRKSGERCGRACALCGEKDALPRCGRGAHGVRRQADGHSREARKPCVRSRH